MRPLLVLLLSAILLHAILPEWVSLYIKSQVYYFFTFHWLREIKTIANIFVWIPQQCSWPIFFTLFTFIHMTIGLVYAVNARGWTDRWLRCVAAAGIVHSLFYFNEILTQYAFCDTRQTRDGRCASIILDGVNSVSLFNCWVDGFVLRWVSCIFVVMEGWRVRMDLSKVLGYAVLCSTFTHGAALPLFVLEWRSHIRIADVLWITKYGTESSIVTQAKQDAMGMSSQHPSPSSGAMNSSKRIATLNARRASRAASRQVSQPASPGLHSRNLAAQQQREKEQISRSATPPTVGAGGNSNRMSPSYSSPHSLASLRHLRDQSISLSESNVLLRGGTSQHHSSLSEVQDPSPQRLSSAEREREEAQDQLPQQIMSPSKMSRHESGGSNSGSGSGSRRKRISVGEKSDSGSHNSSSSSGAGSSGKEESPPASSSSSPSLTSLQSSVARQEEQEMYSITEGELRGEERLRRRRVVSSRNPQASTIMSSQSPALSSHSGSSATSSAQPTKRHSHHSMGEMIRQNGALNTTAAVAQSNVSSSSIMNHNNTSGYNSGSKARSVQSSPRSGTWSGVMVWPATARVMDEENVIMTMTDGVLQQQQQQAQVNGSTTPGAPVPVSASGRMTPSPGQMTPSNSNRNLMILQPPLTQAVYQQPSPTPSSASSECSHQQHPQQQHHHSKCGFLCELDHAIHGMVSGESTEAQSHLDAVRAARVLRGTNGETEPGVRKEDQVDMSEVTHAFWMYNSQQAQQSPNHSPQHGSMNSSNNNNNNNNNMDNNNHHSHRPSKHGIPLRDLLRNPSPVPFRVYPTILVRNERYGIDLSIFVPLILAGLGLYEAWAWLIWMDVYVRDHCWLDGFFDYTFDSPSSIMMTSAAWYGLFVWGAFIYSVEPEANRKYLMYPLFIGTFHNVAWMMVVYILWREFRLRYLPAKGCAVKGGWGLEGADRSVWLSSHKPSEYFIRPKMKVKDEQQLAERLAQKSVNFIKPALAWLQIPILRISQLTGLTWFLTSTWTFFQTQTPPFSVFLQDVKRSIVSSLWLNYLDVMYLLHWIIRGYARLTSSAPLPTPSARKALIDWTMFFPYCLTTWVLILNTYVACWYFSTSSATRDIASSAVVLLNGIYIHFLRSHDKIRAQWFWMNYELDDEVLLRMKIRGWFQSDIENVTHAIHASTGINIIPSPVAAPSPQQQSESPEPISAQMNVSVNGGSGAHKTTTPDLASRFRSASSAQLLNPQNKPNTPATTGSASATLTTTTATADEDWYRPFEWNAHVLWTICYFLFSLLAAIILVPDVQFELPWWTKLYFDFRQGSLDKIHRNPTGESFNHVLLLVSLALSYPLFFGFSFNGPSTRKGLPFMSIPMKCLFILPLLFTYGVVWNECTQPCYTPLGMEGPPINEAIMQEMNATIVEMVRQRAGAAAAGSTTSAALMSETTVLRPVHPKVHGCVEAEFTTPYFIPAKFRAGIFNNKPMSNSSTSNHTNSNGIPSWRAFVRFSNGALQSQRRDGTWSLQDDSLPDVRGMAVKLLDVDGEKSLDEEWLKQYPEQRTQDFVTITSEYFFQNSARDYSETVRFLMNMSLPNFISWFFPHSFSMAEIRKTFARIRTLYTLVRMNQDGAGVMNPLDVNYYSAVPYRLGDDVDTATKKGAASMAVKYRWKPCTHVLKDGEVGVTTGDILANHISGMKKKIDSVWNSLLGRYPPDPWSEKMTLSEQERLTASENPSNFLRINLQRRLDPSPNLSKYKSSPIDQHRISDEICFDLMLQDQSNACENKIEDSMKEWRGLWTRVGRLTIPKQRFLSAKQLEFCENLSFNPWHSLKVHKPLGEINQLRRTAYLVASDERRKLNKMNTTEIKTSDFSGKELSKLGEDDYHLNGEVALYSYSNYGLPYNTMPRHITVLPHQEHMTNNTGTDIMSRYLFNERSIAYPQPKLRLEYSTPQDYEYYMLGRADEQPINNTNKLESGRMRRPKHVDGKIWTNDAWWAAQFIRGLNPMMIQRVTNVTQLPWEALGEFDAIIHAQIALQLVNETAGTTLESLANQGRIYYCDYEELDDIATYGDRVLYSPIVVFYLPGKKTYMGKTYDASSSKSSTSPPLSHHHRELLPLFIQLDRQTHLANGVRPRLFFPAPVDPRYPAHATNAGLVWLFAKMHVSSADAVLHQMIYHLLETHLSLEPVIVATHRAFSPEHHILRLLKQHFIGTLAINDFGRNTLLSDMHAQLDGFLATGLQGSLQIMQKHYRGKYYRFMETVPEQLRRRGFDVEQPKSSKNWGVEQDELPGFLYRDYGLAIYWKFRAYVHSILVQSYGEEPKEQQKRFDEDSELHAWLNELSSPLAANIPNVPSITNYEALVNFVTQIMYQGSVQHAAVNFGQFEAQAFQPSRPLYLTRGMPYDLSLVDHSYMLRSLMPLNHVHLLLQSFDVLAACCVNTLMLDLTEADGFVDPQTTIVPSFPHEYASLMVELRKIEMEMKVHNEKMGYDYIYLYPSRIPQSIAI